MKKIYNAAIIGCGAIGRAHIEGYQLLENINLTAVVDPYDPARENYQDEYKIPYGFKNISDLKNINIDIVSICTPHLHHHQNTIDVSKLGVKGIICEKPMTIGSGNASKMINITNENNCKLIISHQRRFTPGWIKAREIIKSGEIGSVSMIDIRVEQGLLNWATHTIDGALFSLDDPSPIWVMGSVERNTDRYERNVRIEDSCIGLVQLDNSSQLFIQSDLSDQEFTGFNNDAGYFSVIGTKGMLNVSENKVLLFSKNTTGWSSISLGGDEKNIKPIGGKTNADQIIELIKWIEGGPEHRGSAKKAKVTLDIMMSIYESARINQKISFPVSQNKYPLDLMVEEEKLKVKNQGKYDIRGYLNRNNIDEEKFKSLRKKGIDHHQIMHDLNKELTND